MTFTAMQPPGTITSWGEALRGGDDEAATLLWGAYVPRLVRLAEGVLRQRRLGDDAEDAALSAFQAFCHGMKHGRFRAYRGRNAFEALLVTMTVRKARDYSRRLASERNGGRLVRCAAEPDQLASPAPDPAFLAAAQEAVAELLAELPDETCRAVAVLRAAGYTEAEMAMRIGRSRATVDRKLRLIRKCWGERLS